MSCCIAAAASGEGLYAAKTFGRLMHSSLSSEVTTPANAYGLSASNAPLSKATACAGAGRDEYSAARRRTSKATHQPQLVLGAHRCRSLSQACQLWLSVAVKSPLGAQH